MAHMSRWLMAVLGTSAILAAWLIPPEHWSADQFLRIDQRYTPERVEAQRLRSEVIDLNNELRERRLAAHVATILQEEAPAAEDRVFRFAPEHDADAREYLTRVADSWLGEADYEPSAAFALIFVDEGFGNHEEMTGRNTYQSSRLFVGLDGETPYCAVAVRYDPHELERVQRDQRTGARRNGLQRNLPESIRTCRWFAEYGRPGSEMADWLIEQDFLGLGQWHVADSRTEPIERAPFGRIGRRTSTGSGWSCQTGHLEACARVIGLDGSRWAGTDISPDVPGLAHSSSGWGRAAFGVTEYQIFAQLEEEFGPEAFRDFWTSEAPVGEAFQAAFGLGFPEWLFNEVRGGGPALTAGAGLDFEDWGLSLLTLFSFLAVAVVVAKRRTV